MQNKKKQLREALPNFTLPNGTTHVLNCNYILLFLFKETFPAAPLLARQRNGSSQINTIVAERKTEQLINKDNKNKTYVNIPKKNKTKCKKKKI